MKTQGCHRQTTVKAGDRLGDVTVEAVSTVLRRCKTPPPPFFFLSHSSFHTEASQDPPPPKKKKISVERPLIAFRHHKYHFDIVTLLTLNFSINYMGMYDCVCVCVCSFLLSWPQIRYQGSPGPKKKVLQFMIVLRALRLLC